MTGDIYEEIVELRRKGLRAALATIISRSGSTPRKDSAKMLIYEDGRRSGTIGGGCMEAEVCRAALAALQQGRPRVLSFDLSGDDAEDGGLICGGTLEVHLDPIEPDPNLFIFGAGHVGRCVAEAAATIGFRITVVDDRIKYANRDRFPNAASLVVGSWDEVFAQLAINESSYLLIATRGHQHDLVCLRFALQSAAGYVGLLGSKRKIKLFEKQLLAEGMDPALFRRLHSPVGIEIGAETPEEIAVSIAAELIAVRKKRVPPGEAPAGSRQS